MLNAYGVDSISIVRDGGRDQWNEPLASTVEAVNGYVEWKTKMVRNQAGEEVLSRGYVILDYDGTIDHEDKIRIDSVDYPIIMIESMKDFSNVGTKVYLQ